MFSTFPINFTNIFSIMKNQLHGWHWIFFQKKILNFPNRAVLDFNKFRADYEKELYRNGNVNVERIMNVYDIIFEEAVLNGQAAEFELHSESSEDRGDRDSNSIKENPPGIFKLPTDECRDLLIKRDPDFQLEKRPYEVLKQEGWEVLNLQEAYPLFFHRSSGVLSKKTKFMVTISASFLQWYFDS